MSKWNKISLFKFQQIEAINSRKDLSEFDKTLFCTCVVFGMTEYQLDNAGLKKVQRLTNAIAQIFNSPFQPEPQKRIGRYFLTYDMNKITFGQYIELSFYLSVNPTMNAHRVLASISHTWKRKNKSEDHSKKAEYFLKQPVEDTIGSMTSLMKQFTALNNQYKALFGLDDEVHGPKVKSHPFIKTYGWVYAASQVAEYERITVDEAYGLPVRQAFHDLTYLKARGRYETQMMKENSKPAVKPTSY